MSAAPPDALALATAARRALAASRYLARALAAQGLAVDATAPEAASPAAMAWLQHLAQAPWDAARLDAVYAQERGATGAAPALAPVARALRRTRRQLLCGLLLRDCAGWAPLEEVTAAMTAFAQLAVRAVLDVLVPPMAARHGTPLDSAGAAQDLLVLAMGKAGVGELNVSSDLDLIFVYGEAVAWAPALGAAKKDGADTAAPAQLTAQEYFERLGRGLIGALNDHDGDGFVFRIDMRLRPHGDAGPLVVSLAMLEEYLVREGREWERFAWAKARVISQAVLATPEGFAQQVRQLDSVVQPFIYRKYFDFGAIGAIRDLHRKIRTGAQRRAPGRSAALYDVKLGRGGIREIEFLAQTYCIMRGGRDHRLRGRGTIDTLQILAQAALIDAGEAQQLMQDYRFLRRLEHALQYRNDAQTHAVPADPTEQAAVAQLLGMDSGVQMLDGYRQVSESVARSFDRLFPVQTRASKRAAIALEGGNDALAEPVLARAGFADPAAGARHLQQLLAAPRLALMSAAGRATVEKLCAEAVHIIGSLSAAGVRDASATPDALLLRWIRLVEVIGRRGTYFSLLLEFPQAHERVLRLLAAGGWAADYLLRHPILLDELIDPRTRQFSDAALDANNDSATQAAQRYWIPWSAEIEAQLLAAPGDVERQMNVLRDAHHAQVFRLLLADLAGHLQLEHLADHLSALADAVLALTLDAVWRSIAQARGTPLAPMPRLAIVAYGKLGGRELGYASDLDLAFVYEDGAGSATAQEAEQIAVDCTLLVRRLLSWLASTTSSGILFEIDLRLRPNGNAGLLVTPIAAFERYQSNADGHGAWVWEHQALTRARACAGNGPLCARVERLRADVLGQSREASALAADVVAMRQRMLEGHPNRSGHYDLKHDRGGMVDIEFIVQYLVLAHAHRHAELLANRGNIGLLAIAADLGLIAPASARACADAYRRFRRLQHALRLNGQAQSRVDPDQVRAQVAAVCVLWQAVLGTDAPLPGAAALALGAR